MFVVILLTTYVNNLAVLESRLRVRDDDSGEIASDLNGDDNEGEQQLAMDEGDIDLPKDSFAIFPEIAPNIMQFPDEFRAGTTSGTISKLTRADLYDPKHLLVIFS